MVNSLQNKIQSLFEDKTVSALLITEYLHWAAYPEKFSEILAMPPIQRGFVWKAKQIQDLWDSLLRGMPIGSILLKKAQCDELSAGLAPIDRKVEKNPNSGFHLMDGQQRTLAMLLGFPSSITAQHKLWIDFSESGKNGSQFQFRVTTAAQPFGYLPDGSRLPLSYRRDARTKWDNGSEINKKKTNQDIFDDARTRPWKAGEKQQAYIIEVKKLWQLMDQHRTSVSDWVAAVKLEISEGNNIEIDKTVLNRIEEFGTSINKFQNQWLALIKIPEIETQIDIEHPSHDYLTILFDRISSNGTRLSPDDLLFSMIKQSWPEAHNIVYDLQEEVGSLMKPTDFVMTAFRLAVLQSENLDPELNAQTFHKRIPGLLGASDSILRKMIGKDGPLSNAFKQLIALIKYQGGNDYGIPNVMFPYMNESMLQVILYWIICNQDKNNFIDSRDEVLRFIMFWFVCNRDSTSALAASKKAIEIISNNKGKFPGVLIYKTLTSMNDDKCSLFHPLIYPPEKKIDNKTFRNQQNRENDFFGNDNAFLYRNFTTRKMLLIWFQREYVESKYPEASFKPMAGQDEDNVPYDFDHLVPQSNWSSLSGIYRDGITDKANKKIFEDLHHRRALGNSIGNYRVLDSFDNRSRQDEPLGKELLELNQNMEIYSINPHDEIELQNWKLASPASDDHSKCYKWDDDRLLAFQSAVESRVIYLYERYFTEVKFEGWLTQE